MFASPYFAPTYFAPTYFPPAAGDVAPSVTGGTHPYRWVRRWMELRREWDDYREGRQELPPVMDGIPAMAELASLEAVQPVSLEHIDDDTTREIAALVRSQDALRVVELQHAIELELDQRERESIMILLLAGS